MLGINAVYVQLARLFKGLLYGFLCDLIKHHAVVTACIATNRFLQMPGNRLSLAIEIRREIDGIAVLSNLAQVTHYLFFTGQNLVLRGPAIVGIDAHSSDELLTFFASLITHFFIRRHFAGNRGLRRAFLGIGSRCIAGGGQITDMPDAGLHNEVLAKIFVDGLGLGRRLNNNQCFTHIYVCLLKSDSREPIDC